MPSSRREASGVSSGCAASSARSWMPSRSRRCRGSLHPADLAPRLHPDRSERGHAGRPPRRAAADDQSAEPRHPGGGPGPRAAAPHAADPVDRTPGFAQRRGACHPRVGPCGGRRAPRDRGRRPAPGLARGPGPPAGGGPPGGLSGTGGAGERVSPAGGGGRSGLHRITGGGRAVAGGSDVLRGARHRAGPRRRQDPGRGLAGPGPCHADSARPARRAPRARWARR